MKRNESILAGLTIPSYLKEKFAFKEAILHSLQQFLLCKDHETLPPSSLFDNISLPQLLRAKLVVYPRLRDYQLGVVKEWEQGRVYAKNLALGGPSGSGKTFTIQCIMSLYLLNITMTKQELEAIQQEQDDYVKDAALDDHKKAKSWGTDSSQDVHTLPELDSVLPSAGKRAMSSCTMEPGRITYCAVQNETADKLFDEFLFLVRKFAQDMNLPPFLGLRVHSEITELDAALEMLRPSFNYTPDEKPRFLEDGDRLRGTMSQALHKNYTQGHRGSRYAGIKDRRFVKIHGSMANYMLELASAQSFDPSPELKAAFSPQELRDIKSQLQPLYTVSVELRKNGDKFTKDLKEVARRHLRIAYRYLLERASFVVTTLALATSDGFNIWRQSHFVALEEAGRANGNEAAGIQSKFWNAKIMASIGCWKQLPPQMFGPESSNPFHAQGTISFLKRLHETGFFLPELEQTARFKNATLLQFCRIANHMPNLQAVEGSFKDSPTARQAMMYVWNSEKNAVFIHIADSPSQKTSAKSLYNAGIAIVVMSTLLKRLRYMTGDSIAIMTPYRAQCNLYKALVDCAMTRARDKKDNKMVLNLSKVLITTVDSMMGDDREHMICDLGDHLGFVMEHSRFVVFATRARSSTEWFGDVRALTMPNRGIDRSHPFFKIIDCMQTDDAIISVSRAHRNAMLQYTEVLDNLGMI